MPPLTFWIGIRLTPMRGSRWPAATRSPLSDPLKLLNGLPVAAALNSALLLSECAILTGVTRLPTWSAAVYRDHRGCRTVAHFVRFLWSRLRLACAPDRWMSRVSSVSLKPSAPPSENPSQEDGSRRSEATRRRSVTLRGALPWLAALLASAAAAGGLWWHFAQPIAVRVVSVHKDVPEEVFGLGTIGAFERFDRLISMRDGKIEAEEVQTRPAAAF